MSAEVLARAPESGEANYVSRSSGVLWKKRETSGQKRKGGPGRGPDRPERLSVLAQFGTK
jgi:hypothetical protein